MHFAKRIITRIRMKNKKEPSRKQYQIKIVKILLNKPINFTNNKI